MPKRPLANEKPVRNDPHVKELYGNQGLYRNALVSLSARVLSNCGFVLSLFAIWFTWLMPTAIFEQRAPPDIRKLKSRINPLRSSIPPTVHKNLAPILATNTVDTQPARRVYFADATPPDTTVTKQATLPPDQAIQQSSITQASEATSQVSLLLPTGPFESLDSLALDSDSSSRPSSRRRSSGLTKFKLGFRSYSLDITSNQGSVSSDEYPLGTPTFLPKGQRTSLPPPAKPSPSRFHFRRCSVPSEQDPRTPKPIPRTQPYGPPYFATPPILLDDYYSPSLPQFKDESQPFDSDSELSRSRIIRRVNLNYR